MRKSEKLAYIGWAMQRRVSEQVHPKFMHCSFYIACLIRQPRARCADCRPWSSKLLQTLPFAKDIHILRATTRPGIGQEVVVCMLSTFVLGSPVCRLSHSHSHLLCYTQSEKYCTEAIPEAIIASCVSESCKLRGRQSSDKCTEMA